MVEKLLFLLALARVVLVSNNSGLARMTLPGGGNRWSNPLIDKQDVTLFALRPLLAAGLVTPAEKIGDLARSAFMGILKRVANIKAYLWLPSLAGVSAFLLRGQCPLHPVARRTRSGKAI